MKILGIIAEYNPFHNGHQWHIDRSKVLSGATHTLVLMSGSAVQRGGFAVQDKWQRAEAALAGGADLVCELPYMAAGQTADIFARGAIDILDATGVCDYLSFGSEYGRIETLRKIASLLARETPAFRWKLGTYLKEGQSFPRARALAVADLLGEETADILSRPNNILALEYLKSMERSGSTMEPITFQRRDTVHDAPTPTGRTASASWLRHSLLSPDTTAETLAPYIPYPAENLTEAGFARLTRQYETTVFARLASADLSELRRLPDVSEGLEFALKNALETAASLEDLVTAVSSKRIPKSRIRRILMNLAMNLTDRELVLLTENVTPYLRVLGFNGRGQEILAEIKKRGDLPILTNLRSNQTRLSPAQRTSLELDVRATNIRSILLSRKCYNEDYTRNPIRKEDK